MKMDGGRFRCLYDALAMAAAENKREEFDQLKSQISAECRTFDPTSITSGKSYTSPMFIILMASKDFDTLYYYKGMCHLLQLFCQLDRLFISRLYVWLCGFGYRACFRYTCLWLSHMYLDIHYCPFNAIIFDHVQYTTNNGFLRDLLHLNYPLHLQIYRPHVQNMLQYSVKSIKEFHMMLMNGLEPTLKTIISWIKHRDKQHVAIEALAALPQIRMVDVQYSDITLISFYLQNRAKIYWRKLYYFFDMSRRRRQHVNQGRLDDDMKTIMMKKEEAEKAANTYDLSGNSILELYEKIPWALWPDAKHVINLTEMSEVSLDEARDTMTNPYTRTSITLAPIRQHLVNTRRKIGRHKFNYHMFYEEPLVSLQICGKNRRGECQNAKPGEKCACPYRVDISPVHLLYLYAQTDIWAHLHYPPDLSKFYNIYRPGWRSCAISFVNRLLASVLFESMSKLFYHYGEKISNLHYTTPSEDMRSILLDYIFVLIHFRDDVQTLRIDWVSSTLQQTFGYIESRQDVIEVVFES